MSVIWTSWFVPFFLIGLVNSLLGTITAICLPNIHAFQSASFGSLFGPLFFLNVAFVTASFFLAALCGTSQSNTLTVFAVMCILVASFAPTISISANMSYNNPLYSYGGGSGGAFWQYTSTSATTTDYENCDPDTGSCPL